MIVRPPQSRLSNPVMQEGHETENIMSSRRERPVAIRLLGATGKEPVTCERMAAIRNIKTMAGSPDADRRVRSASRNLAHGLFALVAPLFREPMKEDRYVQ
jgi:hypothetical protein